MVVLYLAEEREIGLRSRAENFKTIPHASSLIPRRIQAQLIISVILPSEREQTPDEYELYQGASHRV